MIKISKDNLLFWRYFFGGGLIATHLYFIVFVFFMNFVLVYVVYFFFAVMHFAVAKVWRYLFIKDVYLSSDFGTVIFKSNSDEMEYFKREQISNTRTSFGITEVVININGNKTKFYFMINSKENLKYISAP